MSTRSLIGQEQANGSVRAIYCHSDGYPSYNGAMLLGHWKDIRKVETLMAHGDMSHLSEEIGEEHDFQNPHHFGSPDYEKEEARTKDWCCFYRRDRDEEDVDARDYKDVSDFYSSAADSWAEYIYVMDKEGNWYCSTAQDSIVITGVADMELLTPEVIIRYITECRIEGYQEKEVIWAHDRMGLDVPDNIKEILKGVKS